LNAPNSMALIHARGYVSPFPRLEATNSHYLACRLIWAATYVRLFRDSKAPLAETRRQIIGAGHRAQIRFTEQFADAGEWLVFLSEHPDGI